MAVELKDPDGNGILEFTQTVEDVDGDNLFISLELNKVNGTVQSGPDRDPSWLSFTTSSSLKNDGTRVVDINVEIDASELGGTGTIYEFELEADDGVATSTCIFTLNIKPAVVDGSSFFTVKKDTASIIRHDLNTNWDASTTKGGNSISLPSTSPLSNSGFHITANGENIYVIDRSVDPGEIIWYTLGTPYDLSTMQRQGSKSFQVDGRDPAAPYVTKDGTVLVLKSRGISLADFTLSTPYDITTASLNNTNLSSFGRFGGGVFVSEDQGKVYLNSSDDLESYDFGTKFDVSTLTNKKLVQHGEGQPTGLYIKPDGTKYYHLNDSGDVIEFDMSTPYDIGTISRVDSVSIGTDDSRESIRFGVK